MARRSDGPLPLISSSSSPSPSTQPFAPKPCYFSRFRTLFIAFLPTGLSFNRPGPMSPLLNPLPSLSALPSLLRKPFVRYDLVFLLVSSDSVTDPIPLRCGCPAPFAPLIHHPLPSSSLPFPPQILFLPSYPLCRRTLPGAPQGPPPVQALRCVLFLQHQSPRVHSRPF